MSQFRDIRQSNWFWTENDLIDRTDLNTYEKMVYIVLIRHADKNGSCFPSYDTIAKKVGCSRRKAIDVLKSLEEKKLLIKETRKIKENLNNSNMYFILSSKGVVNEVHHPSECDALGSECDALGVVNEVHPNNTHLNNTNKTIKASSNEDITHIVEYLNLKANKKYNPTNKKTVTLIRARLNEKYTIQDFETVIDTKVKDWIDDPKFSKYLRPETLFGTKFENYLNESTHYKQEEKEQSNVPFELSESDRLMMEQLNNPK